eukprot:12027464-Ditylum_brightwellii.AAC.1
MDAQPTDQRHGQLHVFRPGLAGGTAHVNLQAGVAGVLVSVGQNSEEGSAAGAPAVNGCATWAS